VNDPLGAVHESGNGRFADAGPMTVWRRARGRRPQTFTRGDVGGVHEQLSKPLKVFFARFALFATAAFRIRPPRPALPRRYPASALPAIEGARGRRPSRAQRSRLSARIRHHPFIRIGSYLAANGTNLGHCTWPRQRLCFDGIGQIFIDPGAFWLASGLNGDWRP
jgi:hypothetical protein